MARGYWRNWENLAKKGRSERKPNEMTRCHTCGAYVKRKDLAKHILSGHK